MHDQRFTTDHEREAYDLGVQAAVAAASWVLDGNASQDHIARMVAWLDDGDPRADDFLPAMPDLSGEWADAPTGDSLAVEIVGAPDLGCGNAEEYDEVRDAICDAWEAGVSDAFQVECERLLRAALVDETPIRVTIGVRRDWLDQFRAAIAEDGSNDDEHDLLVEIADEVAAAIEGS